jgi:hypothetical protein
MSTIEIRLANLRTYSFYSEILFAKDCDNQYSCSLLSVALRKTYCDLIYSYWPNHDVTDIKFINYYTLHPNVNTNTNEP